MSLIIRQEDQQNVITQISQVDKRIEIVGSLTLLEQIDQAVLVIDDMYSNVVFLENLTYTAKHNKGNKNVYEYTVSIDMEKITRELHKATIEDMRTNIAIRLTYRNDNRPYLVNFMVDEDIFNTLTTTYFSYYRSASSRFFSFRLNSEGLVELTSQLYDRELASRIVDRKAVAPLMRSVSKKKNTIMIGGESPKDITENTFNTFLSLLGDEDQEVYYILDEGHPLFRKLAMSYNDSVVGFKSEKYVDLLFNAGNLLTAGTPDLFYPTQNRAFQKAFNLKHILMPAAMLGLRSEYYTFNQRSPYAHRIDKIFVGSKIEARFVERELTIDRENIVIDHLPLRKTLEENTKKIDSHNKLVLLPAAYTQQTHNIESNSLSAFFDLAASEQLRHFSEEAQLEVVLVVPEHLLAIVPDLDVKIETDTNLINRLATARLLITDYHPIALDYSLGDQPVLFYRPFEKGKIVIDGDHTVQTFENDLPGDVINNEIDLFYLLEQFASRDFTLMREQMKKVNQLRYDEKIAH